MDREIQLMHVLGKFLSQKIGWRFTMSVRTKTHHTKKENAIICMIHDGDVYQFPKDVALKYRIKDDSINASILFKDINQKYSKPGALLRGIRVRENYTQTEMASKLKVSQSDISQMEHGVRKIGRKIAQRIEELFDVDYRSFLE